MKRLWHYTVFTLALCVASCSFQVASEQERTEAARAAALKAAFERGYWAGWKQHEKTIGGGL